MSVGEFPVWNKLIKIRDKMRIIRKSRCSSPNDENHCSTSSKLGFWGGQTGNVWGDALFALVLNKTDSTWLASLLDEIVVDVPDKLVVVLVSYAIFRGLPRNVVQLYNNNNKVENLD